MLLPCGTARLAVLSSRAEPNSVVPRLMVSNGVLLPCLNQNDTFIWVRHDSSTTFGTGLSWLPRVQCKHISELRGKKLVTRTCVGHSRAIFNAMFVTILWPFSSILFCHQTFFSRIRNYDFDHPSEGHKHGGHDVTKTSVVEFCFWNENFDPSHIEINVFSSASTI